MFLVAKQKSKYIYNIIVYVFAKFKIPSPNIIAYDSGEKWFFSI